MASDNIRHYDFEPAVSLQFDVEDLLPFYQTHREQFASPHRTGFHQILWFRKGIAHTVDFESLPIRPDTLVFLTRDTVHQFTDEASFECKGIMFSDQFFAKSESDLRFLSSSNLFNGLFPVTYLYLSTDEAQLFAGLVAQMETELKVERDAFQQEILRNLLHNFLLHCERNLNGQPRYAALRNESSFGSVVSFRQLIEEHFRMHKQVSQYAEMLHLTPRRLTIATGKAFGKTPKQLIDDRLVLEAKRLLVHSPDSIKEIGFDLGFEEPTNFIKYFRKQSGITPAEFRRTWARV